MTDAPRHQSVLLIGGDRDGAVVNTTRTDAVVMAAAQPGGPHTAYALRHLALFGRTLTIGVAPGITLVELDRLAMQHVLTPTARNLLVGP